jgi:HK97 gp10 family phage protein
MSKASEQRELKAQAEELKKKFQDIETAALGSLEEVLTTIGIQIQNSAKYHAPVDTGLLRKSITYRLGATVDTQYVEIGTANEYAPFVEFGVSRQIYSKADGTNVHTKGSPAQPFLTTAFNSHKGSAKWQIRQAVKNAVEKEGQE